MNSESLKITTHTLQTVKVHTSHRGVLNDLYKIPTTVNNKLFSNCVNVQQLTIPAAEKQIYNYKGRTELTLFG